MNGGSESNNAARFLLPKLKSESEVKPGVPGEWDQQPSGAFQSVASSLDFKPPSSEIKSVSSIPNMWARPLSMEMALHNYSYPIRSQMIEQWQGMLAAIALTEMKGFDLRAELLELGNLYKPDPRYPNKKRDRLVSALHNLRPSLDYALYTLTKEDGETNPWLDIYILLWNGKPVGMTSPSTLVCPSEDGDWTGLPWWSNGRLRSPINYLNSNDKAQLRLWLANLHRELGNYGGNETSVHNIGQLLEQFQNSLGAEPRENLELSEHRFFGEPANKRGVLIALDRPIKAQLKDPSVLLVSSKDNAPPLLIIAPDIADQWGERPQDIWIYGTTNLASLKLEELPQKKVSWGIDCLDPQEFFLQEFYFIKKKDALPGSLTPTVMGKTGESEVLTYENQPITPLIPIDSRLLQYFKPEELFDSKGPGAKVKFQLSRNNAEVTVILELPLSGTDGESPRTYKAKKDYPLKNALLEVPVLEVWPNFKADNWQEYYALYYYEDDINKTFQVRLPKTKETRNFEDANGTGSYQIAQIAEFPEFVDCRNKSGNRLGLILLQPPKEVGTTTVSPWTVGVDFGTSFTNVYVNQNGNVARLPLEPLYFQITQSTREERRLAFVEGFVLSDEMALPPSERVLPLSSVLTTRGRNGQNRSILDGRIYIANQSDQFKPQDDWIKTELKWVLPNKREFNELFLKHLALQITAQAVKNNVKQIQWALSYPSVFSRPKKNQYIDSWQEITENLQNSTGVTHICPEADETNFCRTESVAVAQYFAKQERGNLVNSICIDMGGGTSDIAIWEEQNLKFTLVHQCSVRLAGHDLFSQFLEMNRGFLERYFKVVNVSQWEKLRDGRFNAKLDVFLREKDNEWLKKIIKDNAENKEFQGFIQLVTIGIAGLYYYVGLILKALHTQGKYAQNKDKAQITIPRVYIGGNGSRILHWLAESGQFKRNSEVNILLSSMLSQASGFKDTGEFTRLSSSLKDEVACGLVLPDQGDLQGLKKKDEGLLILGEDCEVNGEWVSWNTLLSTNDEIREFKVPPTLVHLPKFLESFHLALQGSNIEDSKIETIKPLVNYTISHNLEDNKKLWSGTIDQITRSLVDIKAKAEVIRPEPPFILGLKGLLYVLGNQWAEK